MKKDLIIISCSNRKKEFLGKVKAWDLYDGIFYRMLKKNNIDFNKFDIFIISAKYGLITPDTAIEYYDQKMTKDRASSLEAIVSSELLRLLSKEPVYNNIYLCLGKLYMKVIRFALPYFEYKEIKGGIGVKLGKLKKIITEESEADIEV